jgi:hypothetical protein
MIGGGQGPCTKARIVTHVTRRGVEQLWTQFRALQAELNQTIDALDPATEAFQQATALMKELVAWTREVEAQRTKLAGRVAQEEAVSLAVLADKLGVSKSRAKMFKDDLAGKPRPARRK